MNVESKLKVLFFQNSSPDEIYSIIKEFSEQPKNDFIATIDCLMEANLDIARKEKAILAFEELFLLNNFHFLRKYLFMLYDSIGNEPMARYFLDICNEDDPDSLLNIKEKVNKYQNKLIESIKFSYFKNNFSNQYQFNNKEKSYSVFSYSNEIGNNMTLIKTPYGALIFDCGAKCSIDGTIQISSSDIKEFLFATDTEISDIKGCFISHAHLDHYGSINSIIEAGLEKSKIFIGKTTKDLILNSAQEPLKIKDAMPSENFFVANNAIKIHAITNGHILGSQAFLISFDCINILFTGDFSIHDQLTVKGMNVNDILKIEQVKKYGVDCLITETTYGHSIHYLDHDSSIYALIHFTDILLNLDYKVFFPSFAIGRSQEIACMLNSSFSILLDGLSVKISKLYESLSENKIFNDNTRFNVETDKMYNFDLNKIIIASSGMLTKGSTSYRYMEELLKSKDKIAVFKTGFISSESAGNELLDEWKTKENVFVETPLSAHASYDEIIKLINDLNPNNVVSIHGDGLLLHDVEDTALYDVEIEKTEHLSIFDNEQCESKSQIPEPGDTIFTNKKTDEDSIETEQNSDNEDKISFTDFLNAKNSLDTLFHINDGVAGYKDFLKAVSGNKLFENASFEYIHKRDVTPDKQKGLYITIPALDFKGYNSHSDIILREVYNLICKMCDEVTKEDIDKINVSISAKKNKTDDELIEKLLFSINIFTEKDDGKKEPLSVTTIEDQVDKPNVNNSDFSEKEKIEIVDLYLRSRIDNVVKCGQSLNDNKIPFENSPSFISAVKLLIKFLKMHSEFKILVDMLVSFETDYSSIFDVVLFIKEQGYCYYKWEGN